MDNGLVSRRSLIAAAISIVPSVALSSVATAASTRGGFGEVARTGGARSLGTPKGAVLHIQSLDSSSSHAKSFDALKVPFGKAFGLREHTAVPAPYYFDVDLTRRQAKTVDYDYAVNIYDSEGNDIGSATAGDGATAIFVDQQIMIRIEAVFD